MNRRSNGFAWIELVVTLLVLVFIALLIPPFFAPNCARPAPPKCINNLKQIGIAIEMYEDDYGGAVLPWRMNSGSKQFSELYWADLIKLYIKQLHKVSLSQHSYDAETIFRCPSAPKMKASDLNPWQNRNYGYNPYLTTSVTAKKVLYPSLTLRVTESALYNYDIHNLPRGVEDPGYRGGSPVCPIPKGKYRETSMNPQSPDWNNGYQYMLWFDGHVSVVRWQKVMLTDKEADPNVWCRLSPKKGYTP